MPSVSGVVKVGLIAKKCAQMTEIVDVRLVFMIFVQVAM